jgi:hypothetical protein
LLAVAAYFLTPEDRWLPRGEIERVLDVASRPADGDLHKH